MQPGAVNAPPGRRAAVVLAALLAVLLLVAAEPTDDPLIGQQTHLEQVGVFQAWDVRRGEGAVVAVLDTGVDLDHPDLAGRLVEGIDLVEVDTPPDDPQGHGTIVAGIIAAVADNGRGVAGVAPQAQVMPIRVLDAQGRGTSDVVAEGIRHAIERQVEVINLSLAEVRDEDEQQDTTPDLLDGVSLVNDREVVAAIEEADEAGILVVAAAGNDGRGSTPYDTDTPVLVVGAVDADGAMWEDSNHDDRTIFAPGVEILSTWNEQRYARSDGTSFATPIVAAGAAMLRGAGLDSEQTLQRLVDTAVPVTDQQGEEEPGLGLIDLAAAVQDLDPAPPTTPPPPPPPPASTPPPTSTTPPASPSPVQPSPSGPLEVAEPVEEVVEPQPAQVTEAPPPITPNQPTPTRSEAPTPVAAIDTGPVEVVTDPSAPSPPSTTPPPITVEQPPADDGDERAAAMTVATMLLGVDVLLAGWVLGKRRDPPT